MSKFEKLSLEDIEAVKHLWTDYLTWGNDNMQMNYGVHPHDPTEQVELDIKMIHKFLPPNGRIMLSFLLIMKPVELVV